MQKGSGEAMLVKFLNPFEDEQKLFMGASKQVQCKNVQCNKFNSLQYSIINAQSASLRSLVAAESKAAESKAAEIEAAVGCFESVCQLLTRI